MIDWYEVVEDYNYYNDTEYTDKNSLIRDLYLKLKSIPKVSLKLKVSNTTIKNQLIENGIEIIKVRRKADNEVLRIYEDNKKELSIDQIAKKLGYNTVYFRRKLNLLGVKLSENGRPKKGK